ncbi:beta-lactamase family protein [Sphingomonas sp. So64.6b]|uniref:serine hydrolase domain-containing protein n=1 Tax=Sphingomonas sp. So64.6b TaxID=2997354 RepID=UPI001601FB50|nr:serine hydrolase domain-containing protein [Sphingomonas sp. So64.6b]QNA84573.1 beta-lactamase family protein [Sphingomonas sp. So64.6b]
MLRKLGMAMALIASTSSAVAKSDQPALDTLVRAGMAETGARGIAIAYIDHGKVVFARSWGARNGKGDPLTPDTVMYGASLTKAVFGYFVMQLVDEGRIDLDRSIANYLPKPLPDYTGAAIENRYARWSDLAGDERWRKLTPRILLNHGSGFANFGFNEPDGKLRFHFDPGTHYSYSGDGIILLQFVLEAGLGLDIGQEMQERIFDKVGAIRTGMMWRPDFATNLADGWQIDGKVEPHDERSKPRAAGSMDTTIADMAKIAAVYMRGDGLKPASRAELVRPQLPIRTVSQFPVLQPDRPVAGLVHPLAAALGVVTFRGDQGPGFFKGGHNDSTANTWVCVEKAQRCVVILSNDVRAEPLFPRVVKALLGDTGVPWAWEYGDLPWTRL